MSDQSLYLIEMHRQKLQDLHQRAARAIRQVSDADVNWRPNEESNSIANLVVHLAGNLGQRLVSTIGGAPDVRERDAEFNTREQFTRERVLAILDQSFGAGDGILAELRPERLGEHKRTGNKDVTVLDVMFAVATHASEHVGQIMYIAKLRLGPAYQIIWSPHKR